MLDLYLPKFLIIFEAHKERQFKRLTIRSQSFANGRRILPALVYLYSIPKQDFWYGFILQKKQVMIISSPCDIYPTVDKTIRGTCVSLTIRSISLLGRFSCYHQGSSVVKWSASQHVLLRIHMIYMYNRRWRVIGGIGQGKGMCLGWKL